MKYIIRFFLKPMSLLPAILMLYVIFTFSAQESSASNRLSSKVTVKVVSVADRVFDMHLTESQTKRVVKKTNYYIRKLAHFSEYFILAICISIPLYVYGLHCIWILIVGVILCFGFAAADEWHQFFVDGRSSQMKDVIIDTCGSVCGIIFALITGHIFRKCIYEPIYRLIHHKNRVKN